MAVLVCAGIVTVAGTAAAKDENDGTRLSASERGDGGDRDRGGDKGDRGGKGDRGDKGDRDDKGDGKGKKDDDKDKKDKKGDKDKGKDKKDDGKKDEDEEFPGRDKAGAADDDDFVDINDVRADNDRPRNDDDASTGSFVARCGIDDHDNSDNFMAAPGKRNGAQHVHDYVGNKTTDANSTDDSLHAGATTCDRNNQSAFFWPVVRLTDQQGTDADEDGGGKDGNFGRIVKPKSVDLRFLGNEKGKVVPMPDDLQIITGDAKAVTNGDKNANAQWTCTGFENRITDKYPLCPAGSRLERILEFPSCWNGEDLSAKDQRSHMSFPRDDGSCKRGFKAIPKLRITLTYDRPNGRNFALDSFPDQRHNPKTDHSDFMNIASDQVLKFAANCINTGKNC
ncbi:MAG TPA: DUF1996 domain-containing protein [Pseudonocardia sp.]